MPLLWLFCLFLTITLSISMVTVTRDIKSELLLCNKQINCTAFKAMQINESTCSCEGGTFYYKSNNELKCFIGSGLFARCSTYFDFYNDSVQAISVINYPATEYYSADEFGYSIKTGVTCSQLEIDNVMSLDQNMAWQSLIDDFKIVHSPANSAFYLRWKNPLNIATADYFGNLLKFSLTCTQSNGVKLDSCLLGKIIGHREYHGENLNNICGIQPVTENITATNKITTALVITPTVTSKKQDFAKPTSSMSLILLVAVICFTVIVVILVIMVCCLWRKRKQRSFSKSVQQLTDSNKEMDDDLYTVPSGPQDVDNPSYLTHIIPQCNDKPCESDYSPTPYENTKRRQAETAVKKTNIYDDLSPFSKNYYETPDQRTTLLTDTSVSMPRTEYAELLNHDTQLDTYVLMDNPEGAYVPMELL